MEVGTSGSSTLEVLEPRGLLPSCLPRRRSRSFVESAPPIVLPDLSWPAAPWPPPRRFFLVSDSALPLSRCADVPHTAGRQEGSVSGFALGEDREARANAPQCFSASCDALPGWVRPSPEAAELVRKLCAQKLQLHRARSRSCCFASRRRSQGSRET